MILGSWLNPGGGTACGVIPAAVLLWMLLRWWRGVNRASLFGSAWRLREQRFVYLLRAEAFADPAGVVMTLLGNNADWYLRRLWTRAADDVAHLAAELGREDLAGAGRGKPATAAGRRPQRPAARPVAARGWALAVVTLPESGRDGQTQFVCVAVPALLLGRLEAARARRAVRFLRAEQVGPGA